MPQLVYPWGTEDGELAKAAAETTTSNTQGLVAVGVDAGGIARFLRVDNQGRVELSSGGILTPGPAHYESAWFAGVESVTEGLTAQLGTRSFPAALFPATLNGLSRVIRLHVVAQMSSGAGPVQAQLIDISTGSPTPITNATLSTSSATPVELVSAASIPVADAPGSLYLTGSHLYELNITTPVGAGNVATISSAWLSVDYE